MPTPTDNGLRTVPNEPPPRWDDDLAPRRADEPPNDLAAEQELIGLALYDINCRTGILDLPIQPTDFYRHAHELLWTALRQERDHTGTTSPALVAARLTTTGNLQLAGGLPYLHTLTEHATTIHAAPALAERIRGLAAIRQLIEQLEQARRQLHTHSNQPGAALAHVLADTYDDFDKQTHHLNGATTNQPSSWQPVDLEAVLNGDDTDPAPQHLPRSDGACLIYAGAVHTLSGEPESGKSWLALLAAHHELQEGDDVAYIDFEDRPQRVTARLLALGTKPGDITAHLRYLRPSEALDDTGRTHLDAATRGTTLTIIDGVTEAMTLHGLDLSANPDVAAFYDLLPRRISARGGAVILIDHVVKDNDKQGRWGIGGQHKLAGIDGAAYLVKVIEPFGRGKKGTARITLAKDRPGHVMEYAYGRTVAEFHIDSTDPERLTVSLHPPEAMPADTAGEMRPTYIMRKVSAFLAMNPDSSQREIERGVPHKLIYVRQALRLLIREGYVALTPGPRRAHLHRLVTMFDGDSQGARTSAS